MRCLDVAFGFMIFGFSSSVPWLFFFVIHILYHSFSTRNRCRNNLFLSQLLIRLSSTISQGKGQPFLVRILFLTAGRLCMSLVMHAEAATAGAWRTWRGEEPLQ